MTRRTRIASLAVIALAVPLVLTVAGNGSGADPAHDAEAGVCEASSASVAAWNLEDELARLSEQEQAAAGSDLVVLNNRGYNYGPPPDRQLEMIRLQALTADVDFQRAR